MSKPEIFNQPIPPDTVRRLANETFEDMIKFVVDIHRQVICAGGGLHSDEEKLLLEEGSQQSHLWGANYYLDNPPDGRWEYVSMINVRPSDGNRKQTIESEELRQQVCRIARHFFEGTAL